MRSGGGKSASATRRFTPLSTQKSWLYEGLSPSLRSAFLRLRHVFNSGETARAITYADKPLPLLPYPLLLRPSEARIIQRVCETAVQAAERLTHRAAFDKDRLKSLGFGPLQRRFIRTHPGYDRSIPIARVDAYWDGRSPTLLEINTDGTAYLDYAPRLNEHFLKTYAPILADLPLTLSSLDPREPLLRTLIECYEDFCLSKDVHREPRPRLGILDRRAVKTGQEQENLARYFSDRGVDSVRIDPSDLRIDRGRVNAVTGKGTVRASLTGGHGWPHGEARAAGKPLDLIYRRLTSREIFEASSDLDALLTAYRKQYVCVVGSFRSDVAFHKGSLELSLRHMATSDRSKLRRLIPKTHLQSSRETESSAFRNRAIYKPRDRNQGGGIRVGQNVSDGDWQQLNRSVRKGDGVFQRLLKPQPLHLPPEWGIASYGPLYLNLGVFLLNGRFAGLMARLTPDLILSEPSPEWLIPVFVVKEK